MSIYNNTIKRTYDYLFVELADPRTNDWPLIRDPWLGLAIIGGYLYFVLNAGPALMKNRKPYELNNLLITYNFLQVLISTYLFCEGMGAAWLTKYSWTCEPVDFSNSPHALRVARGVYVYFIAKLTELLDTIFFVLRKKDNQISFLHLYHHTIMPMVGWGATKYFPGGHGTFIGVINSFVHILMYFYYMMAAMGPQYQKYLWWKKHITILQLLQFCIAFLHSMQLLFYDCGYPRWTVFFTLPNAIFFYYLFSDFYNKAYVKKDKENPKRLHNVCANESSNNKTHREWKPDQNGSKLLSNNKQDGFVEDRNHNDFIAEENKNGVVNEKSQNEHTEREMQNGFAKKQN